MKIYKYRSFNEYSIKSLLLNQLWFSKFDDFNDPFDGWSHDDYTLPDPVYEKKKFIEFLKKTEHSAEEIQKIMSVPADEIRATNNEQESLYRERFTKIFLDLRNKLLCLCFSASSDNPLMWSHYGDGLRGFCLEFDEEKLELDGDLLNGSLYEVEYRTEEDLLQIPYVDLFLEGVEGDRSRLLFKKYLVKSEHWKYEEEYRVIRGNLDSDEIADHIAVYNQDALTSVLIGDKASSQDRQLIERFCRETGITLKQASKNDTCYRIDINEVEL